MEIHDVRINIAPHDGEAVAAVQAILRDFNRQANREFWAKYIDPSYAPQKLELIAVHGDSVIGGLLAETTFQWLRISIMAVDVNWRRQRIGGRLLELAEEEARRRNCEYAYVDTMSFQAPDFYIQHGYQIAGRLPDWDSHGHDKLFLTKRLERGDTAPILTGEAVINPVNYPS